LAAVAALFAVVITARNLVGPYYRHEGSRVQFPGRLLAQRVDEIWQSRYDRPLTTVGGEWWLAGNAALYAPHRPQVYGGSDPDFPNVDSRHSPWLSDAALVRSGGVLVWNARRFEGRVPSVLRKRFPGLKPLPAIELPWQTEAPLEPVRVGIAVIPPRGHQ
jgi:hypothetical protein